MSLLFLELNFISSPYSPTLPTSLAIISVLSISPSSSLIRGPFSQLVSLYYYRVHLFLIRASLLPVSTYRRSYLLILTTYPVFISYKVLSSQQPGSQLSMAPLAYYCPVLSDKQFPHCNDRSYTIRPARQQPHFQPPQWQHTITRSSDYQVDEPISTSTPWNTSSSNPAASTAWSSQPFTQTVYRSEAANPGVGFSTFPEYPQSAQRTVYSTSPLPSSDTPFPLHPYRNDISRSSSSNSDYDEDKARPNDLYVIPNLPSPSPVPSAASANAIKVEPEESNGGFIMEFAGSLSISSQSQAPPTEVPLRATQASPPMRKMMGVFRLNPFTIHDGEGRSVPAHWGEPRPLDHEPATFEFQIDLGQPSQYSNDKPRPFSPSLSSGGENDVEQSEWGDYDASDVTSWDVDHSQADQVASCSKPSSKLFPPRSVPYAHTAVSQPYSRRIAYPDPLPDTNSSLNVEFNRLRLRRQPSEPTWSPEGLKPLIAFAADAESNSLSAVNRQWPYRHEPCLM